VRPGYPAGTAKHGEEEIGSRSPGRPPSLCLEALIAASSGPCHKQGVLFPINHDPAIAILKMSAFSVPLALY
jgi:hypothetical protein